jgi:hypothetical protein|tara:strand:+ start:377 stop:556 length:180 start_codon:yes stop_codon:yes gene_type:complete
MNATVRWVVLAAVAAGFIGAIVARMAGIAPVSTMIGAAIGGGIGGWIAKKQGDQRNASK